MELLNKSKNLMFFFLFIIYLKAVIVYTNCTDHCSECHFIKDEQECITCEDGYNGLNYTTGGCFKCNIDNCHLCYDKNSEMDYIHCGACNKNYHLVNNYKNCCLLNQSWNIEKQMCVLIGEESDSYSSSSSSNLLILLFILLLILI